MSRLVLRSVAIVVLACTTVLPIASAAPARGENRPADDAAGVAKLSRFLPELWASLTSFLMNNDSSLAPSALEKAGSSLDPSGHPAQDAGSSLDPSGGTHG